jgi:hypothetical protein
LTHILRTREGANDLGTEDLKKRGKEKEKCVVRLAASWIRVAGQLPVKILCSCSQKTYSTYMERGESALTGEKLP